MEGVKDMYIKIEDLKNATVNKNSIWDHITDSKGRGLSAIINALPHYPEAKKSKKKVVKNEVE